MGGVERRTYWHDHQCHCQLALGQQECRGGHLLPSLVPASLGRDSSVTSPSSHTEPVSPSTCESDSRACHAAVPSSPSPQDLRDSGAYQLCDDILSGMDAIPELACLSSSGFEDAAPAQSRGVPRYTCAQQLPAPLNSRSIAARGSSTRLRGPSSQEFSEYCDILPADFLAGGSGQSSAPAESAPAVRVGGPAMQARPVLFKHHNANAQDNGSWDSEATWHRDMQRLPPPPPSLPYNGMQLHPVPKQLNDMRRPRGPDFAMLYAFLGSLFDPACAGVDHCDVLAQMAPVDRETAFLLMRNLADNLPGPAALVRELQGALGATVTSNSLPLHSASPRMQAAPNRQRVMLHPALQAPNPWAP